MFQAGNPSLTWSHKEIVDRIGSDGTTVGYVIEEPFYFLDGTNAVRRDGNVSAGPVADEEGNDVWRAFQYEPVMTHNGVPVVRGTYQAVLGDTRLTFGLLNSLAFGVTTGGDSGAPSTGPWAAGLPSWSNPVTGGATWTGVMIGSDVSGDSATFENLVMGDATVRIDDLTAPAVDVALTGIWDVEEGTSRADMTWSGLSLEGGVFTDVPATGAEPEPPSHRPEGGGPVTGDTRTITGSFFGASHGEVGGVFDRDGITGAFGAKRD